MHGIDVIQDFPVAALSGRYGRGLPGSRQGTNDGQEKDAGMSMRLFIRFIIQESMMPCNLRSRKTTCFDGEPKYQLFFAPKDTPARSAGVFHRRVSLVGESAC